MLVFFTTYASFGDVSSELAISILPFWFNGCARKSRKVAVYCRPMGLDQLQMALLVLDDSLLHLFTTLGIVSVIQYETFFIRD